MYFPLSLGHTAREARVNECWTEELRGSSILFATSPCSQQRSNPAIMIISPPPQHNGNSSTLRPSAQKQTLPSPSPSRSSPSARPRVPHWGFDKCLGFNDQVKWCHGRHDDDATQLAPHTKDKGGGGRPLWGGGGGLHRWWWWGSWPIARRGGKEGRRENKPHPPQKEP